MFRFTSAKKLTIKKEQIGFYRKLLPKKMQILEHMGFDENLSFIRTSQKMHHLKRMRNTALDSVCMRPENNFKISCFWWLSQKRSSPMLGLKL